MISLTNYTGMSPPKIRGLWTKNIDEKNMMKQQV